MTVCCGLELGSSGDCQALKKWTERQIDLFGTKGLQLHQIRIKNPGQARSEFLVLVSFCCRLGSQGKDWTADAVWAHIETMIAAFKEKGLPPPIVHIHNHDTHLRNALLVPRQGRTPSLVLRRTSMVLPHTWGRSSSERLRRCDRPACVPACCSHDNGPSV